MSIKVKRAFRLKPETNTLLNAYVADSHSNGSTTYGAYSHVVDTAISTHCTIDSYNPQADVYTYGHNSGHVELKHGELDICRGCPHKEPHK